MKEQIIELLSQYLDIAPSDIGPDFNKLDCSNWDSIAHLTIVAELEAEFDCSFEPEEMETMNSLKQILALVGQKTQ